MSRLRGPLHSMGVLSKRSPWGLMTSKRCVWLYAIAPNRVLSESLKITGLHGCFNSSLSFSANLTAQQTPQSVLSLSLSRSYSAYKRSHAVDWGFLFKGKKLSTKRLLLDVCPLFDLLKLERKPFFQVLTFRRIQEE